jgi:osmotically-inducible protein OsmY
MKTDEALQKDVMEELTWEPILHASEIGVAAKDGVINLSGHVANYAMKMAAERAAKRVEGVKVVVNEIVVKTLYGQAIDDDIAHAVVNAFKWYAEIPEESVKANVQDGWITLEGMVDWNYQKELAQEAVQNMLGVRGVTNSIRIKPKVSRQNVKAKIREAFKRSAALEADRIRVETQNGKVILRGTVHAWNEREEAEHAAWAAPGVTSVEDNLVISD